MKIDIWKRPWLAVLLLFLCFLLRCIKQSLL